MSIKMRFISKMHILWTSLFMAYLLFSLSSEAGYFISPLGNAKLAISVDITPTESCSIVGYFDTLLECFTDCLGRFQSFYMFSRDAATLACLCCKDAPSSLLSGNAWNTYIAPPCPKTYAKYTYGHFDICLRFVPIQQKYPMATSVCQQDGGDLVRLDSDVKFDIFQQFVANSTNATVEVWVQAIRVNYAWLYHDGTPLEFSCMVGESNGTGETRMRALSAQNFGCFDAGPGMQNIFVCEIYRVFTGF